MRLSGYRLHRPQLRWALRRADRVTAVSESLRDVAVALGIPAQRVRVIPNGVDPRVFSPMEQRQARRQCGLPENATVLLTVAGIYDGKGQHLVVEALPSLLGRYPDALYVMVGGSRPGESYRRRLEGEIRRRGLEGRVLFAGPRPQAELPEQPGPARFHGAEADPEQAGDLGVGMAEGEEAQDLQLVVAQHGRPAGR